MPIAYDRSQFRGKSYLTIKMGSMIGATALFFALYLNLRRNPWPSPHLFNFLCCQVLSLRLATIDRHRQLVQVSSDRSCSLYPSLSIPIHTMPIDGETISSRKSKNELWGTIFHVIKEMFPIYSNESFSCHHFVVETFQSNFSHYNACMHYWTKNGGGLKKKLCSGGRKRPYIYILSLCKKCDKIEEYDFLCYSWEECDVFA